MMNRTPVSFPQFAAPRRTYRDIPDRMTHTGQLGFGAMPGTLQGLGAFPGAMALAGQPGLLEAAACGALPCCPIDPPTQAYERVVGLPRICIPGCDCETAETTVCGPFTLTGLYVAPKVAHFLSITRIQIGCNNLMVNCDPIPAELFSCCEIDDNVITAPTIEANSPLCFEFENESNKELELKAAVKGLLCSRC